MKHLLFIILFFIIHSLCCHVNAQILDTISEKQFTHYSFKEYEAIYKGDQKALKIVNRCYRYRTLSYTLYFISAILSPTAPGGPQWTLPALLGASLNLRNTKKHLYMQLKTYEKYHHHVNFIIAKDSSYKDILSFKNSKDSLFTISLSEFKKLSIEKIKSRYNVNDTTHLIFKLFERDGDKVGSNIGGAILYPLLGILAYVQFGRRSDEEIIAAIVFVPICTIATAIYIPSALASIKNSSREYLFYSLQEYFNHDSFDYRTNWYIKDHIKNIKY